MSRRKVKSVTKEELIENPKLYIDVYMHDTSIKLSHCKHHHLPYIDDDGEYRNTYQFGKVGQYYLKHGRYHDFDFESPEYIKFWEAEEKKCIEGVWMGQLRVTGYHYFFLNFYPMMIGTEDGEEEGFASFLRLQFNLFHLFEYCDIVKFNIGLTKVRGCGLTECAVVPGVCDFFIYAKNKAGKPIFKKNVYFAYDDIHINGPDAIRTKATSAIEKIGEMTNGGIEQPMDHTTKSSDIFHWVAGYKKPDGKKIKTGGEIYGKAVKTTGAGRAGRVSRVFYEESGQNLILGKLLITALEQTKRLGKKTGYQIIWGTSGEDNKGIDAFRQVIYDPSFFECIKFKNQWKDLEKNPDNVKHLSKNPFEYMLPPESEEDGVGWFVPTFEITIVDDDGNPDYIKGIHEVLKERKKKEGGDPLSYIIHVGDHPITIEESLRRTGSNYFDSYLLSTQHVNLTKPNSQYNLPTLLAVHGYKSPYERGFLHLRTGPGNRIDGVDWELDMSKGTFYIREHPQTVDGVPYKNLYVQGIDSIDQSPGESASKYSALSKFATMVKKRIPKDAMNDTSEIYVAMYNERSADYRHDYYAAMALTRYYNADVMLEFTKKEIITHYRNYHLYHHFMKRPSFDNQLNKNNKQIGIPGSKKWNEYMDEKIKEYILDNWNKICFPQLVEQLLDYDSENRTKFDLVVAMGLCEAGDEDIRVPAKPIITNENDFVSDVGYYKDSNGIMRYGVIPRSNEDELGARENKTPIYIDENNNYVYREDLSDDKIIIR